MESELQQSKIKLKLDQPAIICGGRKRIECFYRGKITARSCDFILVEFKSYGKLIKVQFDQSGKCLTKDWQDLKIVS